MNDMLFMKKALQLARKALNAGEFPVGCVLAAGDKILVTASRTGTAPDATNEIDHAEVLALKKLADLKNPVDPAAITVYSTLEPCLMCFGALLISGVTDIVYAYEDAMGGGTRCDLSPLPPLYQNLSVAVVPHILRTDSLQLFKTYFSNPQTVYLKKSYLATYTLNQ